MTKYTLTVVDTSGIQDYVFGVNNLRQNVGASYLVDCATGQWAVDAIPCAHNVIKGRMDQKQPYSAQTIQGGEIQSEVIYSGGGNIVVLFASRDLASEFSRRLTRRLLMDAPGLRVVISHCSFDWETEPLGSKSGVLQQLMRALALKKSSALTSAVMPGLGVTAQCVFTGAPAVGSDPDQRPISLEAAAKLKAEPAAHDRLKSLINLGNFFDPPHDFDQLGGSKGEKNYIAIVHSDGNGIGKRIEAIRDDPAHALPGEGSRAYINKLREFSLSIEHAALDALQSVVDLLIQEIDPANDMKIRDTVRVVGNRLPFRPIVYGGDDVTFVCDGRLGLSLAQRYVSTYAEHILADNQPAHCRAGVAIVRTHFPFARGYALAEELCASAKKYIQSSASDISAIDWHTSSTGVLSELKEIRLREFLTGDGDLLMRPLRVTGEENDWRTWSNFVRATSEFQSGSWSGKHNKVKALRDALRKGESATKNFLELYSLKNLPILENKPADAGDNCAYWNRRCAYFDAVEAVDMFVHLDEQVKP